MNERAISKFLGFLSCPPSTSNLVTYPLIVKAVALLSPSLESLIPRPSPPRSAFSVVVSCDQHNCSYQISSWFIFRAPWLSPRLCFARPSPFVLPGSLLALITTLSLPPTSLSIFLSPLIQVISLFTSCINLPQSKTSHLLSCLFLTALIPSFRRQDAGRPAMRACAQSKLESRCVERLL